MNTKGTSPQHSSNARAAGADVPVRSSRAAGPCSARVLATRAHTTSRINAGMARFNSWSASQCPAFSQRAGTPSSAPSEDFSA